MLAAIGRFLLSVLDQPSGFDMHYASRQRNLLRHYRII
jgi:hypothetical protein